MTRFSRRSETSQPPKSQIGLIVFVLGTVAAFLILFPPWESKEERQDRMMERVMRKVEEAEGKERRLLERVQNLDGENLNLKVVTTEVSALQNLLTDFYRDARALLAEIDAANPASPLAEINRQAGKAPVVVEERLFDLLTWCVEMAGRTDGYVDPTMRPYYELWNFDIERPLIADPQVIESRIPLVGYAALQLDPQTRRVQLPKEGMGLDLRMLRNGLVLRELRTRLDEAGFTDYFAFLGTDSVARGTRLDGEPWQVAVQHPRKTLNYYARVTPGNLAVMVANDYERGFIKSSYWYHPYLNPYTGAPEQATNSLAVIGPDPLTADVLAFALFTMGVEKALTMIENFPDYAVVIMDRSGKVSVSAGGAERVVVEEGQSY